MTSNRSTERETCDRSADLQGFFSAGLVAHDRTKAEMADWVRKNLDSLRRLRLYATGSTARILRVQCPSISVHALRSGPLGGDQQLGAMIAEGRLHALFFFVDSMTPQPHDVDIKALIRLSTLYEIPVACNRVSADCLITSPLFGRRGMVSSVEDRMRAYITRPLVGTSGRVVRGERFVGGRTDKEGVVENGDSICNSDEEGDVGA